MLFAEAWIEQLGSTGQWWVHLLFELVISILAVFLILLVLVQRGRGGGLAGALGGMGGQSAFGTRAGDTFTWITYATAAIWILLAMLTIKTFTDPVADRAAMIAAKEEKGEDLSDESDNATLVPRPSSTGAKTDVKAEQDSSDAGPSIGGDFKEKARPEAPPAEKTPEGDAPSKDDTTPAPETTKETEPKTESPTKEEPADEPAKSESKEDAK